MAAVDRPFPPGEYPVVVVGSGPGGLQTSYFLRKLGIEHAVISKDEGPGGMFRQFPLFDRLVSWTKPHAPVEPGTREYEWFDWNSLLAADPKDWVGVGQFMDGTSEFPSREEMEQSITAYSQTNAIAVRYGCTWEGTERTEEGFVLHTSDGDYKCRVAVFGVGVAEPWKPSNIPGIEHVPHYIQMRQPKDFAGKSLYILGKATSAFEVADGLLPWAKSMVLSSPSEVKLSVVERSLAGLRARYTQPLEDYAIGGRTVTILDASTERIEKTAAGFRVSLRGTMANWELSLDFDEAVATTGVSAPLQDLPDIGVATFSGGRLPGQTPYWESASVPGIFFTGSITQGAVGMRGPGGAAVHAFRYCTRILASHIAEKYFDATPLRTPVAGKDLVSLLLYEASRGPELWNQKMYLSRVIGFDPESGIVDEGIHPLAHFVDYDRGDGIAVAVTAVDGVPSPVFYLRRDGRVEELIGESDLMLDFATPENRRHLESVLKDVIR